MTIDPPSFAFGLFIGGALVGTLWFLAGYLRRELRNR